MEARASSENHPTFHILRYPHERFQITGSNAEYWNTRDLFFVHKLLELRIQIRDMLSSSSVICSKNSLPPAS